jgi:hypothetical protein
VNGGLDKNVATFTANLEYELGETKRAFTAEQVMDDTAVKAALAKVGAAK